MASSDALPNTRAILVYRAFLVCALAGAAIAATFFAIVIGDGSVSSFNIGLWLLLLAVLGAVPWAGHALRKQGKVGPAIAILGIVAVPGLFGGMLLLLVIITHPHWN